MADEHRLTTSPRRRPRLDELQAFATAYGIPDTDPHVASLLATLEQLPRHAHLRERLLQLLDERLDPYMAFHAKEPFRVMPGSTASGEVRIGSQVANNQPVMLSLQRRLNANLGIFGITSAGKTNVVLHVMSQITPAQATFIILDYKRDYEAWAFHNRDCYVFDATSPIALLDAPEFTRHELLGIFEERWSRALFAHERGREVLYEAWDKLTFPASLEDLKRTIDQLERKGDTYARRDALRGTSMRLQRIKDQYPTPFTTRTGVPVTALTRHSILFPATPSDVSQFVYSYVVGLTVKLRQGQ